MSQLSECHTQPLIPAREAAQMPVRLMARDTRLKLALWNEVHQLREDHPTLIHPLGHHDSNRFAPFSLQVNEKAQVTQVDKNLTGQLWGRPSFSVVCQPDQGSHSD